MRLSLWWNLRLKTEYREVATKVTKLHPPHGGGAYTSGEEHERQTLSFRRGARVLDTKVGW